MATDEYRLDDLERSQLETTRQRRQKRNRRFLRLVFSALGCLALALVAAPSIFSHTSLAKSMLSKQAAQYGWQATAGSIDIGWITPLKIHDLSLVGPSGETQIQMEQIDSSLTVMSLLGRKPQGMGEVTVRGAKLACTVRPDGSSIEQDLAPLMEPSDEQSSHTLVAVKVQDFRADLTDSTTGESWVVDQSNIAFQVNGNRIEGDFAGALGEPNGNVGALQTHFAWLGAAESQTYTQTKSGPAKLWEISVDAESFPMSTMNLVARRFAGSLGSVPQRYSGETTGKLKLVAGSDGAIQASLSDIRIRELQTATAPSAESSRAWKNELATLDGEASLAGGWFFGHGLEMTTDFASATLDGAFPTTVTLTGSEDNPVRWLQSLNGTARVDLDLADLDRALPGLLPLRDGATLVQGRARLTVKNDDLTTGVRSASRRSKLLFASDAIRARSGGRPVVIDPIELNATVVTETDPGGRPCVRAEEFSLVSQFATASGAGDLQNGSADFQMDFGRLNTMLRPLVDLSEVSLAGTAEGKVRWNAESSDAKNPSAQRWQLQGDGQANGLLVTLPGGHRFKRAVVRGELQAVGQFQGQSLRELRSAQVAIHSGGVAARAELLKPVSEPTANSIYPIRLTTDGRLENLSESIRPWIPESIRGAEGRVVGTAVAKVSATRGTIQQVRLDLSQPKVAYGNGWYGQSTVDLDFDGSLEWPSGDLSAEKLTIIGDAFQLSIEGNADAASTQLDVAWRADLERLQNSASVSMARAKKDNSRRPTFQSVSFRPVKTASNPISGQCEGKSKIVSTDRGWQIITEASATGIGIYPSPDFGIVPPGQLSTGLNSFNRTSGRGGPGSSQRLTRNPSDALWYEPRMNISGPVEYIAADGSIESKGVKVSCDWLAGTMAGKLTQTDQLIAVELTGPSRWNLPVMAERLTEKLGTNIVAAGVHESDLKIAYQMNAGGTTEYSVTGDLGWDRCEIGNAVAMGNVRIPFRLNEKNLRLASTRIPLEPSSAGAQASYSPDQSAGTIVVAADVQYAESPMTIRLDRGARIESLVVTPEHAANWLQYVAPLAAGATRVDGILGAEFDEALIVVDDPASSRVRGRLNIENINLASGPMADQLIQGLDQMKSILEPTGALSPSATAKTLIEFPPQTVEFAFDQRVVTHERLFFKIDRAQVMSSGQVNLNSQIQLVAQVPLDARWLGSDLKGLAGQTVTLPVSGTLSRPSLDVGSLRQMVTQVGVQAGQEVIQKKVDGFIQKQIGSGIDQINEQLGNGLGKIFGGF